MRVLLGVPFLLGCTTICMYGFVFRRSIASIDAVQVWIWRIMFTRVSMSRVAGEDPTILGPRERWLCVRNSKCETTEWWGVKGASPPGENRLRCEGEVAQNRQAQTVKRVLRIFGYRRLQSAKSPPSAICEITAVCNLRNHRRLQSAKSPPDGQREIEWWRISRT